MTNSGTNKYSNYHISSGMSIQWKNKQLYERMQKLPGKGRCYMKRIPREVNKLNK